MSVATPLLPSHVKAHMATASLGRRLYYHPETTSTNDRAIELARAGEGEGAVVYTEHQTQGRGRGDHTWWSAPGNDVLFSAVLRPEGNAHETLPLTLALALGMSVVLSRYTGADVRVKWPNDLLVGNRKLAGVLAESATTAGRPDYVVVGCGINVNAEEASLPGDIRDSAVSCRMLAGVPLDRGIVFADVLTAMETYYQRLAADGFHALVSSFEARSALAGKRVRVAGSERSFEAVVLSVGEDGALRVQDIDDRRTVALYGETVEAME